MALGLGVHSRSQAVGICQVLLDEGALCHGEPSSGWALGLGGGRGRADPRRTGLRWEIWRGLRHCDVLVGSLIPVLIFSSLPCLGLGSPVKHDWTFQDRDAQFYRFPGPEPEPAGTHDVEEELVEATALLSQRGPDALLTVALRKP